MQHPRMQNGAHPAITIRASRLDSAEWATMTITLSVSKTESAVALRLRPWRLDDLPALLTAHRDPVLRRWLATSLADETDARQWLDAQAAGWACTTRFSFAVVADKDDNPPIGHVVVKVGTAGVAEVGYWTAAAVRGQGIAARALDTASRWALGEQNLVQLTRLDLLHAKDNRASCRVAEKCGYLLHDLLPAAPPAFPDSGHRHVRAPSGN
jgi:RimJ/RimL family protein N-acetyltransferase